MNLGGFELAFVICNFIGMYFFEEKRSSENSESI